MYVFFEDKLLNIIFSLFLLNYYILFPLTVGLNPPPPTALVFRQSQGEKL